MCRGCDKAIKYLMPELDELKERVSKIPSEPQLEAAFEVLAWLMNRRGDEPNARGWINNTRHMIKQEVDRCLDE